MTTLPPRNRMLQTGDTATRKAPTSSGRGGILRPPATTSEILNGPRRIMPPQLVIDTEEKRTEGD